MPTIKYLWSKSNLRPFNLPLVVDASSMVQQVYTAKDKYSRPLRPKGLLAEVVPSFNSMLFLEASEFSFGIEDFLSLEYMKLGYFM